MKKFLILTLVLLFLHSFTTAQENYGKILWQNTSGKISLWTIDNNNNQVCFKELGPFAGYKVINYSGNKILWRHDNGKISLWSIDNAGNRIGVMEHGPFASFTVVNYADHKILWRHNNGLISLWSVDDNGNRVSFKEHGPFAGWSVVNYSGNKLLWRHEDGRISLWSVDNNGNQVTFKEHGPFAGWTVVNYSGNKILWRHTDGRISLWSVDDNGNQVSFKEHGPVAGWTVVNYADNKILWRHTDGRISIWSMGNNGNQVSYKEHGPFADWIPVNYNKLEGVACQSAGNPPVMTRFNPQVHGFRFRNDFVSNFAGIDFSGLCGGMAYSALDYFNQNIPVPTQADPPALGTVLRQYIYDRQQNATLDNLDKWAELSTNPFGWRTTEFFNWGLQGFNGGRLQELRGEIDNGRPVPLGLYKGGNGGFVMHHQVLAIGYELGFYTGDLGEHKEDLKIFVYDSNFPNETMVLRPNLNNLTYYYENAPTCSWLSYFVDKKYRLASPPR